MKFAYLIMAHHRFDVLKLLLSDLDHQDNDIFLHIDKKTKNAPIEELKKCVHYSRLIFIHRIPVYWGHASQIQCVMNLLTEATNYASYDYYHLMVGVEFPLMSQDKIHQFFEKNNGYEFIGFDNKRKYAERLQYYYFFYKYARSNTIIKKSLFYVGRVLVALQKRIGVNRLKYEKEYYMKGYANWSITDALARFFVNNTKEIMKECKWSFCADEVCFHTLVFHSDFFHKVYDFDDEYHSAMRITSWTDSKNQMHMEDVTMLIRSGKIFARKFDDEMAEETIRELIRSRK